MIRFLCSGVRWLPMLVLVSCGGGGGGGGGNNGPAFSLSTSALTFSAISPGVTPTPQTVTGSVSGAVSGTLYITILVSGPSVTNVIVNVSGSTGTASVIPAKASTLGPGTHISTVKVFACVNDPTCTTGQLAGSPRTVNVTYQIASGVQGDAVAPRIAITNAAGDVVIRGNGFSQATVVDVTFGGVSASAPPVRVSDTEIHASYPALPAGSHPVRLVGSSGQLPFAGALVVVDPPAYVATTLSYPAIPQEVRALLYDAERQALLVAVSFPTAATNKILRYQFASGAWAATPDFVTVPNLRDIALSLDGSKVLALADTSLTLVDPVTLALGTTTSTTFSTGPPGFEFFRKLVVANDGFAFITTGVNGSGLTEPYLYSTSNPGFTSMAAGDASLFIAFGTPGVSDDGSLVAVTPGDNPPVFKYVASTGVLSSTGVPLRQIQQNISQVIPALNRSGSRIVLNGNPNLNGGDQTGLFDGSFGSLGGITNQTSFPTTQQALAIKPDGTRAYTFDSGIGKVHTFDLTQPLNSGGLFPEVGTGTPAAPGNGPPVRLRISPDGGTLFLAAETAIVILPAP